MSEPVSYRAVVVGAGFSGICAALSLRRAGVADVLLLEKGPTFGGTWRENTYPGCACDVPSHVYSLSFAPHDWSRVFAEQGEIQAYVQRVAREHRLAGQTRFGVELRAARWSEAEARWELETTAGALRCQALILATGPLHSPRLPELPGLDTFAGQAWHTARWPEGVELAGKRVAVVGTGSSAIQLVPRLQREVAQLSVFQRTAPWVLPKPDHRYGQLQRLAFRGVPGLRRLYREGIYHGLELLQLAQRRPDVMRRLQRLGTWHLRRQVPDPALRELLAPDFVLGCKRLLLSNDYYPALGQSNARLVARGVARVTPTGLVDAEGEEHACDAIVWATGFRVTDPPVAELVRGAGGETLAERWGGSPRAYQGTCVAGFPNCFVMVGPNTGNGHSSILTVAEAQADYVAQAVSLLARGTRRIEVRRGVEAAYDEEVQAALAGTVWNAGGCNSYYLDRNGRNSTIYPWTTIELRRRLRRLDLSDFRCEPRRVAAGPRPLRGAVVAITGGARGIGLATARAFRAAGARVILGDLDGEACERAAAALGPGVHGLRLDVTQPASFAAFLERAEALEGPLDVLVNNAGVLSAGAFLEQGPEAEAATFAVNYQGVSHGMRLVLPGMVERGEGHVINVISLSARVPVAGLAHYAASKHAALGLTHSVRHELEGTGVRLSAVLPTAVRTRLSAGIPLGGLCTQEPEDVAEAVLAVQRSGAAERAVPRYLTGAGLALGLLPERLDRPVRRWLQADRAVRPAAPELRRAYEAGVQEQGQRARSESLS